FNLVMEYIEGMTLADYFSENDHVLSLDMVLHIGIQMCEVLHFLHNQKPDSIIYRDIKPGNIIIRKDKTKKLIDFDIVSKYKANRMKDTVRIGTVGFAAPEQFEKQQTD